MLAAVYLPTTLSVMTGLSLVLTSFVARHWYSPASLLITLIRRRSPSGVTVKPSGSCPRGIKVKKNNKTECDSMSKIIKDSGDQGACYLKYHG